MSAITVDYYNSPNERYRKIGNQQFTMHEFVGLCKVFLDNNRDETNT